MGYKEFADGSGIEWYYFIGRMYYPQKGRFPTIDPKVSKFPTLSSYVYVTDNQSTVLTSRVWSGFKLGRMTKLWRHSKFDSFILGLR